MKNRIVFSQFKVTILTFQMFTTSLNKTKGRMHTWGTSEKNDVVYHKLLVTTAILNILKLKRHESILIISEIFSDTMNSIMK